MYIGLRVNYPLLLSDFNKNTDFLEIFLKISQIWNFKKIDPVGSRVVP